LNILAWTILASIFLGMSIYLLLNPTRTGVVPNYRMAVDHWWSSEPIYGTTTHGFLYFPQFILLFTPFHAVHPAVLGEILWRAFGFGLFALALWNLSLNTGRPLSMKVAAPFIKRGLPNTDATLFALVVLAVPASLASLNNGQTNLSLSACLVLAVLALRDQKWNLAAFFLSLGVVLKPIALAPWLLGFAVLPPLRRGLGVGLVVLALLGLAHPDVHYVLDRWHGCLNKILISYTPVNLRVSDLYGALNRAGIEVPKLIEKISRAGFCLAALVWVWQSYRNKGLAGASWALWVATALVFTIFNPRAETNSYVLISPLLAYAAISYWRDGEAGRWKGAVLAAACIGLMCDGMGKPIYLATDVWFKPLIVLLVSPLLLRVPDMWKVKG
jgi:hypothetical protein